MQKSPIKRRHSAQETYNLIESVYVDVGQWVYMYKVHMYEGEVVGGRYICMKERKVHMYEGAEVGIYEGEVVVHMYQGEVVGIYVEGIYV